MIGASVALLKEREKKGLTLEEVAKATKIKMDFISAIEKGEYYKLPKGAYVQGFVRNYIQFLGLPEEKLMALFRREFNEEKAFKVLPEGFARREEFPIRKWKLKSSMLVVLLSLAVLLTYIGFQYRYAFINPPLEVIMPKENSVVSSQSVEVKGRTDPNSTLWINNDQISIKEDGTFKKKLNLFPGKTTLEFKVVNRFGKNTIIKREIEVKEEAIDIGF